MKRTLFSRALRTFAAIAVVAGFGATQLRAEPDVEARRNRRGFNLFASSTVVLIGNRVQCGLDNQGNTCTDVFGSPTGGGGFWPKNTPNQYIFNGGLQIAGILPGNLPVWAGDTVGAYIFDARGTQPQGEQLTLIYNSLEAGDVATWPSGAYVRDGAVYNPALLGRLAISQQDSWVRYWDGSPALLSGRTHPMGIMVEQRTLAWNFPAGNEDIIYVVYDFVNISSGDPASYDGLRVQCEASKALASDPAVQGNIDCDAYKADVAAIGAQYQAGIADRLGVNLPLGGYRIDSVYAAFSIDPDVGNAGTNASTAILPFSMGVAYKSDFSEPTWYFPPDINGAPFAPWPGYVGVKYLKSPIDPATGAQVGLTMFSNTINSGVGFPDPVGVSQLWRYLSGNVTALEGDRICSQANPIQDRLCFLWQAPADTRFYQASGPFSLDPGEGSTIVVAFVHAAPLAAPIVAFGGAAGIMAPGIPASGAQIYQDVNALNPASSATLRPLEYSAGWVNHSDADGNLEISQDEVVTAPRSLLAKSLVAQGIFDANFLLPFAPEPPEFYLVPGTNQVTIVWAPSTTETVGDPYFAIASDVTSPLFDPNYRQTDVEGYRVYRGRTGANLELLAQFDYSGTSFSDFNGAWDYGTGCAPELGAGYDGAAGECPTDFSGGGLTAGDPSEDHDIIGVMPQVSLPGRAALLTGGTVLLEGKLDTFWPDRVASGGPGLTNEGVPFAFIDTDVINSTDYFYAITAFDVNSVNSGPSSLESAVIPQRVTPRADSPTTTNAVLQTGVFGDDGTELDPNGPALTIDAATGRFDGPPPPTSALVGSFAPLVPALLPTLSLSATLDSITVRPGTGACSNGLGTCYTAWATLDYDGALTVVSADYAHPVWSSFDGTAGLSEFPLGGTPVPADPAREAMYGVPPGFSAFNATVSIAGVREYISYSAFEGQAARRGYLRLDASVSPGGSRWFDGANETVDHPTVGIAVGSVAGVDRIWAPIHHTDLVAGDGAITTYGGSGQIQCLGYGAGGLGRQADVQVTWSGGVITARDLTHHTAVDFTPNLKTGWGFVGDNDGDGYISWRDFSLVEGLAQIEDNATGPLGFCGFTDPGAGARASFLNAPVVMPTSTDGNTRATAVAAATGTGFGLYINGERYIFELTGGTLPADGTEWTLRTYVGVVSAAGGESATPTAYRFDGQLAPPVPGMTVQFNVASATTIGSETAVSLEEVHTVPDPYYVTSSLEVTASQKVIKFVNLPPMANIRIYSVSGILVDVISHDDPSGGGEVAWDVRNRNNQFVASGVYFYHIETPSGLEKVGRFTVVNSSGISTGSSNR